ncbi:MAG: DnaJ domain-containing protein [Xenococcaceae cyanobacterium MO_188.B29]|nr:DnaJ domain-containing protein [Xenococcaceae cyanobacterium MO_188.B29]
MNYYQVLQVNSLATQQEIKQAYRRLAKRFHPDSLSQTADHNKIIEINGAYEILSNPQARRQYDRQLESSSSDHWYSDRQARNAQAQQQYRRYRQAEKIEELQYYQWLKEVYIPVNKLTEEIINSLDGEIESLADDPFDDELMENFQAYLETCNRYYQLAQQKFTSQPNPTKLAGVAAHIYYCLNQISDGIKELEWFTLNYDDRHLHMGQEIFRIAQDLRYQAEEKIKSVV